MPRPLLMYLTLFFSIIILAFLIGDYVLGAKHYNGPVSDHFDGNRFFNIQDSSPEEQERKGIFHWLLNREKNVWTRKEVEQTKPASRVEGSELTATFINHATVLIQTEGLNILTDPIYSKRASPFSFVGPKRYADPGVAFDDLPPIDVVIISHNHYDHLNIPTLKQLRDRDNPRIFVPLGDKTYLEKRGFSNVTELDWWDEHTLSDDVSLMSVPAQHFSARSLSDRNRTLWSGYAIMTPHGDTYFAGDTGFGPFVDQIADRFPQGFRLGLLPIGAFKPEWFMKEVHISPDEAFAMQERLNIQEVLAIHFATFKLADDGQDEAIKRTQELAASLPETEQFVAVPNGGKIEVRP